MQKTRAFGGKPHKLEIFSPILLLPMTLATVYLISQSISGRSEIKLFYIVGSAAVTTMAALLFSLVRTSKRKWQIEGNMLYFSRGMADKIEMSLRLDRISSSEMCDNPIYSLFGGTRIRLYSSASSKPVFSMILPKSQAAELINRTASAFISKCSVKPRRIAQKKYSALLNAMTSHGTVIPLIMSVILCVCGIGSTEMYIIASALWIFAVLHVIASTISECKMSVCRVEFGYTIQTGFLGGRRIFIPDRAVIGVIENRSPIAAFCGAGRISLLCAGGRRITCMQWYDGGNSDEAASRIISCCGKSCAKISDSDAVRSRYFKIIILCAVGCIAAWRVIVITPPNSRGIYSAIFTAIMIIISLHCATALKCGSNFGVSFSGSSLRACGMNWLSAEYITLKRGDIATIILRRGYFDRICGTCTAEFIPKGHRHGVKCLSLPYDRMLAASQRIMHCL